MPVDASWHRDHLREHGDSASDGLSTVVLLRAPWVALVRVRARQLPVHLLVPMTARKVLISGLVSLFVCKKQKAITSFLLTPCGRPAPKTTCQ